MTEKQMVCVFVIAGTEVLLGYKKTGFGAGKYNGFGGKVEVGETFEQAAIRELNEESGLVAQALEPAGQIRFEFANGQKFFVKVFRCREFAGDPVETSEMKPQWFRMTDLPWAEMWVDDELWLVQVLSGQVVDGWVKFKHESEIEDYMFEFT